VASVWVHERQHTGQTMSQVMAAFREWFNKASPRRATLLDWEKRTLVLVGVRCLLGHPVYQFSLMLHVSAYFLAIIMHLFITIQLYIPSVLFPMSICTEDMYSCIVINRCMMMAKK
jgi:hypothetical protein